MGVGILCTLSIFLVPYASSEELILNEEFSVSGSVKEVNSTGIDTVETESNLKSVNLRLYEYNTTLSEQYPYLIPFKSYRLEVSNESISRVSVNFNKTSIEHFLENVDKHRTKLWGITHPTGRALTFSKRNVSYQLEILSVDSDMNFSIAVFEQGNDTSELKTAINPSGTKCGPYWSPNSSYQLTNGSCEEFRDNKSEGTEYLDQSRQSSPSRQGNEIILTLIIISAAALIYIISDKLLFLYAKRSVETKTDDVLDHDDISVDQGTLDDIERANEYLIEGKALKSLQVIRRID